MSLLSKEKAFQTNFEKIRSINQKTLDANDPPVGEDILLDFDSTPYALIKSKVGAIDKRKNRKQFMLYPEDNFKSYWDFLITNVLIFTCIVTPARIAFV